MFNVGYCTHKHRKKFYIVEIPCQFHSLGYISINEKYKNFTERKIAYFDKKLYDKIYSFHKKECDMIYNKEMKRYKPIPVMTIVFLSDDYDINKLKVYFLFKNKNEYIKFKLKNG